ncbi:MAG TPA: hypothetical protein VEU62_03495 [Bryobacterales bacterium]|nr:hypothetical protein [Bryobacterales bacterium]
MFRADDPGGLRRGRFLYFPVVPGRLEFAEEVRRMILAERPEVVAVGLPTTLEGAYRRALERLPELSVIVYQDDAPDEPDARAVYIPVEITDPFVEALRTAAEIRAQTVFADPDVGERPGRPPDEDYPDTYAIRRLGLEKYVQTYRFHRGDTAPGAQALARGIAWKLQGTDPLAKVLVVVELNVLDAVMEAMERPQAQPLRRIKRQGVRTLNLHPDCLAEVLVEFPFLQAVYEMRRSGIFPGGENSDPPAASTRRAGGFELVEPGKQDPKLAAIERTAAHLAAGDLDRPRLCFRLFAEAERQYEKNTGEKLAHWQRRLWARYTRNLALTQKQLVAGLFDLTVASRSIADDNFAWELWEMANAYPQQKTATDLMTVQISGEEMWMKTKRILLRRRLPRKKARLRPVGLRGRKKEAFPGEWKKEHRGRWTICSYPPEDLVIENYGDFLKKKGKSILSEERARTEPFTTSLLDGIDLRETIRNWHEGKIYVRSFQKISGEVGAVVVVFDEDRDGRCNYCITWLGEHQNESDMAFYATDPMSHLVGPGIGRAEYGGFLLSLPPLRMTGVWSDEDYSFAESKPERLLLAALDYSLEKNVVYVAARPPRSVFRTIAGRLGRKIIYIPIGQLSPVALKKIRVFHVLDGHDRRETAREYLW